MDELNEEAPERPYPARGARHARTLRAGHAGRSTMLIPRFFFFSHFLVLCGGRTGRARSIKKSLEAVIKYLTPGGVPFILNIIILQYILNEYIYCIFPGDLVSNTGF